MENGIDALVDRWTREQKQRIVEAIEALTKKPFEILPHVEF